MHTYIKMEMKKKKEKVKTLSEEIEMAEGMTADYSNNEITLKKGAQEIKRKMNRIIDVKIEGNKIIVSSKKASKNERKVFGSIKAHIRNMIQGLKEPFKYKLQAVSVHFPMTLKLEKENKQLLIKNFLGEKKDRVIKLIDNVDINVNKDIIELKSADIEKAGLQASIIEKGTKIRLRDRRIFQDGIYITEKPGREE